MRLAGFILLSCISLSAFAVDGVQYNRDVRPVLARHCFACHGQDANKRKGKLRLDKASEAYAKRDGFAAIAPGNIGESELWQRINSLIQMRLCRL